MGARWVPGGQSYFCATINSTVHVVMYSYYFLTGLGYRVWWKKYITTMQLVGSSLLRLSMRPFCDPLTAPAQLSIPNLADAVLCRAFQHCVRRVPDSHWGVQLPGVDGLGECWAALRHTMLPWSTNPLPTPAPMSSASSSTFSA